MKAERETILAAAHETANAIAKNETTKVNLADALLAVMGDALDNGIAIDTVWRVIAERGGYADKANKLDGVKMPGTLATYRSAHRKGEELKVNFRTSWPEFKKSLKPVQLIEQETETEQKEGAGDEVQLTSVVIPRGIAEIMQRYERLRVVNPAEAARFEADMNAAAAKWN